MTAPTLAEIDQISTLAHPAIRNLQITQCYHELAVAMQARTGVSANWCAFATWASKQAGQTIRKEDFNRALEGVSLSAPVVPDITLAAKDFGSKRSEGEIRQSVLDVLNPLAALDRASDAVGRGNKKVFDEIGREFARFYATCLNDPVYDATNIATFCEGLRAGDPPDGQQYLRQAFSLYYQAFFEDDPKTRAEMLLLANIVIGFHEQTRLQPEIAEAMNAALIDRSEFRRQLLNALFPNRGWYAQLRLFIKRLWGRPSPFDPLLDDLLNEARHQAHLVITKYMMTIELPHGLLLRLGEDVPADFPPSLQQLVLPNLLSLLEKFDPTPNSTHNSRAVDWSHLMERLHFIVDMFRCYHESADLFEPPFTVSQVASLKSGRLPDGQL